MSTSSAPSFSGKRSRAPVAAAQDGKKRKQAGGLKLSRSVDDAEALALEDRMMAESERIAGPSECCLLRLALRDESGRVKAGLLACTQWNWLRVTIMFVDPDVRGRGLGSRLLREAEREALSRGCRRALLDPFSFQAPDFYRKRGYEVAFELPDAPPGHRYFFMHKELAAADSAAPAAPPRSEPADAEALRHCGLLRLALAEGVPRQSLPALRRLGAEAAARLSAGVEPLFVERSARAQPTADVRCGIHAWRDDWRGWSCEQMPCLSHAWPKRDEAPLLHRAAAPIEASLLRLHAGLKTHADVDRLIGSTFGDATALDRCVALAWLVCDEEARLDKDARFLLALTICCPCAERL